MSVRVNQRWPDGLKERVEAKVGRSKVTEFTVEALEKALGIANGPVQGIGNGGASASPLAPASSRASSPEERPAISASKLRKFG